VIQDRQNQRLQNSRLLNPEGGDTLPEGGRDPDYDTHLNI
jgi:hypothetical protein